MPLPYLPMEECKFYPHIHNLDHATWICKVQQETTNGLQPCDKHIARSGGSSNIRRHLYKQHPEIVSQLTSTRSKGKPKGSSKSPSAGSQLKDHGYFFISDAGEYTMKEEVSQGIIMDEDGTELTEQDDLIEETQVHDFQGASGRRSTRLVPRQEIQLQDECAAYGTYIAEVLKKMDKKQRAELKREIGQLIFLAETYEEVTASEVTL